MLVRTTATRARCSSVELRLKAHTSTSSAPAPPHIEIYEKFEIKLILIVRAGAKNDPNLMQEASHFVILQILS